MDGVSHYVTVRRDLFTGLVASSTTFPVATLATPIITKSNQASNPEATTTACDEDKKPGLESSSEPQTVQQQHDCSQCPRTFVTKAQMTRHLKSHSCLSSLMGSSPASPPPAGSDAIRCDQLGCGGRVFSSQLSFVKHMKTQHHVVEIESTSPILAEVQIQRADSVGSNTKRHPGEKRFQCGQCSKRFPTSKDLKRHDVVHTGNREFQCSYCSHRFGRKDHRMRHEKKTHASEMLSSSPLSPSNNSKDSSTVLVKRETEAAERRRWRHLSSPSVASSTAPADFEMTEWPIRIRAMSTCEQRMDGPLYSESSLKYLESQLSPDSLLMEDVALDASSLSPDFSSVKEESEETCLSHGSDENTRNDLDWIMADFMIKTEVGEQPSASDSSPTAVAVSNLADLLSPASPDTTTTDSSQLTPEPSSLSPPGLYPPDVIPPDPTVVDALAAASIGDSSKPVQQLRCPKQLMSDILTRTKNPVLPSVYIDSALIVPEPSKQKYHNPHPLLSPEDMDDYYEAFIDDDKEIRENILDMLN